MKMEIRENDYIKMNEDNYPPKEFCKQIKCPRYDYISRIELHEGIGIVDKKKTLECIAKERQEYCEKCLATQYHRYRSLIKSPLS